MKNGFTLVELLVSMVIVMMILAMVYSLYLYGITKSIQVSSYWNTKSSVQSAAFIITKYLHNASTATTIKGIPDFSKIGSYLFLDSQKNLQKVELDSEGRRSTATLSPNVVNAQFWETKEGTRLVVTFELAGSEGIGIKTSVFLNNSKVLSNVSTEPGSSLFFIP